MKNNKSFMRFIGAVALSLLLLAAHAETYAYDAAGRLTGVTYADGSSIAYAYDANGNMLNKTISAVPDVTKPLITLLGLTPVTIAQDSVYNDAGATALDNVDGDITANIVTVNPVNTAIVGAYAVIYNVSDAAGNACMQHR